MRRRGTLLAPAAALVAGLWLGGPASGRPAGCTPGVTQSKGVTARVFCGPATATVSVGGKTVSFRNGSCARSAQYVSVDIGTVVLGTTRNEPDYFGLSVGRIFGAGAPAPSDGTYRAGAIALDVGGKGYAVRSDTITVTLSGHRSKGSFKASLLLGGSVAGSFAC